MEKEMFIQGLGLLKTQEAWKTLFATYEPNGTKRVFVLETKKAGYDQKWQHPLESETLSFSEAKKFLSLSDVALSRAGKETIKRHPKMAPKMVITKVVPESWSDYIVPGWATHLSKKAVRSWEDGSVGTQILACN